MASVATTVASGGLAAALTVIAVTEAQRFGVTISGDEAAAIGTVVASGLHYATRWLPGEKVAAAPAATDGQAGFALIKTCTLLAVVGLGLMCLSSCASFNAGESAVNNYVAGQTKAQQQAIQSANDNAVAIWSDAGCAIPYGAVVRNSSTNPGLPKAIESLCGVLPLPQTPTALGNTAAIK